MTQSLLTHPIHLGRGGSAVMEPEFTGMQWYADYVARHPDDGLEGRLVSMFRFEGPWESWEMHPEGDEVVVCVEGRLTLLQEMADGEVRRTELGVGDYAINPRGIWHSADTDRPTMALFITPGLGTQNRPRERQG